MLRRRLITSVSVTHTAIAATIERHAMCGSNDPVVPFLPAAAALTSACCCCSCGVGGGFRSSTALSVSRRGYRTTLPLCSGSAAARALPASPHQCPIEQVLLPDVATGDTGIRTETLRGMVQLLLDPEATDVEDVAMLDFVVMVPRRQMAALRGRKEWLDVVLSSERYQACKDARALRLAGITTVGRWDENRERVAISAYSRGILEEAYAAMARQPVESQKDQVITWLTRTIQKAVIEEFAANKSNRQILAPLITGMRALPETTAAAASAANAVKVEEEEQQQQLEKRLVNESGAAAEAEEEVESTSGSVAKTSRAPRGRGKRHTKHSEATSPPAEEAAEAAAASSAEAEDAGKNEASSRTASAVDDDEDAEIARLLKETEQEFAPAPYIRGSSGAAKDAGTTATEAKTDGDEGKSAKPKKRKSGDAAAAKKADPEPPEESDEPMTTAADVAAAPTDAKQNKSLARLAELMLIQFNSADGYLHISDIKDDEKKGFVTTMDGDAAQVDPFALYSAFSAAKPANGDSPAIVALKQVWSAYNTYTAAHDAADDDAMARFYKEKGVEALVHGAVLLRAISREHPIALEPRDIPAYGFPLLSSDRRPYRTRRGKGATDMTADRVADAVKAYTAFFASKVKRHTPIRPAIDSNSGCSVAALMGTTLHLYETSLKETVREEDIRGRFAEAMLGVLHVLDRKVLSRVNVVHYHILATSISGGGAGGMDATTTTIVSIDTTGTFTAAEKVRLQQLAEPLGMTSAIADCTCVSDLVDTIEALGVSVVHDILTNRDDLEALLTPTLVQLLPEVEDDEEAEDEEEAKPPARRDAAAAAAKGASAKAGSPAAKAAADEEEEEEEEEEDEEEVEEVEKDKSKGKKQKSSAAKAAAVEEGDEEEEEEEEEEGDDEDDEEEEDEEKEEEVRAAPVSTSSGGKKSPPPAKSRVARGRAKASEEARVKEDDDDDDDDEVVQSQQQQQHAPLAKKASQNAKRAPPPPPPDDDDDDYEEDGEAEVVLQKPPPPPLAAASKKGHAARRAPPPPPPPPVERDDEDDDEEEVEEEVVRRPLKRTTNMKRAPSPAPPPPPRSSPAAEEENEEDAKDEAAAAVRVRGRGRRMSRAPLPVPPAGSEDEDRWFQKARR
ncbi:putative glutamic acid rich protein [Trypanosoma grayi]|uniref:putative glutamic acid rich protein n=1 Tax=Trypanosoma grayi TaxID=71804 RepID=UPI0004F3F736|nr:putative glutamic acid rich protein [Trypanosoma grayi]KEG06656.1 putative glutamic acid rich protein [Trypanosoma grayi]